MTQSSNFSIRFGVSLCLVGLMARSAAAQCGSCTVPDDGTVSGTLTYRFVDTEAAIRLSGQFQQASGAWTGAFSEAGSNISLVEVSPISNGYWKVKYDDSINAYAQAYGGWILIHHDLLAQSDDFILNTVSHELGHALGLGHATNCSKVDSVMVNVSPSEITGAAILPGCADYRYILQKYRSRDDDGDGYTNDNDCWYNPDFDSPGYEWINPGIHVDCMALQGENDTDCDGQLDYAQCGQSTPIILDLEGDGVALTDAAEGVFFDLHPDGTRERIAWTQLGVDEAWLALDRNRNGVIDDGSELFGSFTSQPMSMVPNGYAALSEFDKSLNGGNDDGWIDASDRVYDLLRLWRDSNHDGVSQQSELLTLRAVDIEGMSLSFHLSERRDRWGNVFRYRSSVQGLTTRWAYDVILRAAPLQALRSLEVRGR